MRTNVSAGFKQVRIIEVPDKRGPDNQGCTAFSETFCRIYFTNVIKVAISSMQSAAEFSLISAGAEIEEIFHK